MPAEVYGPFGALVVLVFVLGAVIHGDLVPGFIYKAERNARTAAESRDKLNAESLTVLAKAAADAAAKSRRPVSPRKPTTRKAPPGA